MPHLDRGALQPAAVATAAERLQVLLDTAEIHRMLMTYLRAVDRCDIDLLASVYHDDARDERGPHVHTGGREIAEDILARLTATSRIWPHTMCTDPIHVRGKLARS